ncbi:hypothetical protein CC78DRAFT_316455 [Lojkania enalia]|uniref:Uncharacterized protein n=1 Tax=Lojkania enalia TaxID=147567 RepID=A0A9P4K677_9PLEO|nr:hypothetical protein CC78DRAFT_316455 [Didymosphaeria enalia]
MSAHGRPTMRPQGVRGLVGKGRWICFGLLAFFSSIGVKRSPPVHFQAEYNFYAVQGRLLRTVSKGRNPCSLDPFLSGIISTTPAALFPHVSHSIGY